MIRNTLIAAAALAALTTGFAGGADAKNAYNGSNLNGVFYNGVFYNGTAAQSAAPVIEGVVLPSGVILLAR